MFLLIAASYASTEEIVPEDVVMNDAVADDVANEIPMDMREQTNAATESARGVGFAHGIGAYKTKKYCRKNKHVKYKKNGALETTFADNNGSDGNMFDVVTKHNGIDVTGMSVHLRSGAARIAVYIKVGTWVGFDRDPGAWKLLGVTEVLGQANTPTNLHGFFCPLYIPPETRLAFYVSNVDPGNTMLYTNGNQVGDIAAEDRYLEILQGAGKHWPWRSTFQPRIWNGIIDYKVRKAEHYRGYKDHVDYGEYGEHTIKY